MSRAALACPALPGLEPAKPAARPKPRPAQWRRKGRTACNEDANLEAHVYRKDVVFRVRLPKQKRHKCRLVPRGQIKGFSASSARRLRHLIRNTDDLWTSFLTLTYPGASMRFDPHKLDGPAVKAHIHAFCTWLGREDKRLGKTKTAYVWILEFQERGIPHFHFMLSGFVNKKAIAKKWFEIVGSEDIRHLHAGTRIEGVKNPDQVGAYMGSYMTKAEQKTVPPEFHRVGRFWGASRCLTKTIYRMKGLYRDVARELRAWRGQNQAVRHTISEEQALQGLALHSKACEVDRPGRARKLARVANACSRRSVTYAKRWRWKGCGFVLLRGASEFLYRTLGPRALMRQAVMLDRGEDPAEKWQAWDGKPETRPPFLTFADQLRLEGQYTLSGGFEPSYPYSELLGEFLPEEGA